MSNAADDASLLSGGLEQSLRSETSPKGRIQLQGRQVKLTTRSGVSISRTLPHKDLKRIGAWVFLDSYGPTDEAEAMQVAAHPHTGLQTVTWLLSGSVLHRDSLGTTSSIEAGQLNLMTAGFGIAHSEISLRSPLPLQGVQLWIALPEVVRNQSPHFEQHGNLPRFRVGDGEVILFIGQLLGHISPATSYSPLVGAQISIDSGKLILPFDTNWEHGVQVLGGEAVVDGVRIGKDQLLYFPKGSSQVEIRANNFTQILLIGGEPFPEKIVMWWNFIARSHQEIIEMRSAWQDGNDRFPTFVDSVGDRILAPELPNLRLSPR